MEEMRENCWKTPTRKSVVHPSKPGLVFYRDAFKRRSTLGALRSGAGAGARPLASEANAASIGRGALALVAAAEEAEAARPRPPNLGLTRAAADAARAEHDAKRARRRGCALLRYASSMNLRFANEPHLLSFAPSSL